MKIKLTIFTLLVATTISYGQNQVQKINRENFVGQKVKFLLDNDNVRGYQGLGKSENCYPYLNYSEFKGRTATFIEKKKDLFSLKIEDNGVRTTDLHYRRKIDEVIKMSLEEFLPKKLITVEGTTEQRIATILQNI